MAYVRINMVEFDSPEEFKKRVEHFQKNCADIFPTAQVLAGVQTGEANVLSISIYPDKETADASLIDREKHFDAVMPKDIMYLEGELSNFHLAEMPTVKFDFDR